MLTDAKRTMHRIECRIETLLLNSQAIAEKLNTVASESSLFGNRSISYILRETILCLSSFTK